MKKVHGELREKLMLEKVPREVRRKLMLEKVPGELLRELMWEKSAWQAVWKTAHALSYFDELSQLTRFDAC